MTAKFILIAAVYVIGVVVLLPRPIFQKAGGEQVWGERAAAVVWPLVIAILFAVVCIGLPFLAVDKVRTDWRASRG
jgi:hypothetical protein